MRPLRLFALAATAAGIALPISCIDAASNDAAAVDGGVQGLDAKASTPDGNSGVDAEPEEASTDATSNDSGSDAPTTDASNDAQTSDARSDVQSSDTGSDGAPADAGAEGGGSGGTYLYFADNAGSRVNGFTVTPATGALTAIDMDPGTAGMQTMPTATQPLAVAALPNGNFLFTAHTNGNIGAYAVAAGTGLLTRVDTDNVTAGIQDFNAGGGASFYGIAADPQGRVLYAADYNGNQIVTLSVNPTTGALAVVQRTPVAAHSPRGIAVDPAAQYLFVVGNVLPAIITRVALDGSGIPIAADAGGTADVTLGASGNCVSGALTPTGDFYTACSQDQKIYGMTYDGGAKVLVTTGSAAAGVSPIGIAVHPSGSYAYAASFSNSTISAFSIGSDAGPAVIGTPLGVSAQCRTLGFDGTGAHLFAGCDGKMLTFDVNAATGAITSSGNVTGVGDSTYSLAIVHH